jgi:mRNA interferase HigB
MRILGQSRIHEFSAAHADARKWLTNWGADVRGSRWTNFHDVRRKYPTASFLTDNVVIFNVRGNNYRMETQVTFGTQIIAVKWIGTHAEYDRKHG